MSVVDYVEVEDTDENMFIEFLGRDEDRDDIDPRVFLSSLAIVPDSILRFNAPDMDEFVGGFTAQLRGTTPIEIVLTLTEKELVVKIFNDDDEDVGVFSYVPSPEVISQMKERFFTDVVADVDVSALPKVKIPKEQTDIISTEPIADGTVMADFHGERARHRYYTKATYDALNPKTNPFDRKPINPADVTYYVAELDESLPLVAAGRKSKRRQVTRRRSRKSKHSS